MKNRSFSGLIVMGTIAVSSVLWSGCAAEEFTEGEACDVEGTYGCGDNVLMRCTQGTMLLIEECGDKECEADKGHCHDHD